MTEIRRVAFALFAALLLTSVAVFAAGEASPVSAPDDPVAAEVPVAPADSPEQDPGEAETPDLEVLPAPQPQVCTNKDCTANYECESYCGLAGGRCAFSECPGKCYCYF